MRSVSIAIGTAVLASLFATGAGAVGLTYCPASAAEGYDPALHIRPDTLDASAQAIYDRLVVRRSGGAIVPALAESWDVSKDGLQYVFHLRKGVAFQTTSYFTPSRELSADDVVFSLDRQQNPKQAYFAYAGGDWPYFNAMGMPALVKSVDKVDAATVRVRLTRPDAGFLADLAMDFASILSKEYADALAKAKTPELLDREPVGTGPFILVSSSAEGGAYKANPTYWDGAPKIDDLSFKVVPDPKERIDRLQAGVCDVIAAPDAAGIATAEADPALKVERTEAADIVYLAVNTTQKPFDDPRVRHALSLAIDRPAIATTIYDGLAVPAATIVPEALQSYPANPAPARNVAQAQRAASGSGRQRPHVRHPHDPRRARQQPRSAAHGAPHRDRSCRRRRDRNRRRAALPWPVPAAVCRQVAHLGRAFRVERRQRRSGGLPRHDVVVQGGRCLQPRALVRQGFRGAHRPGHGGERHQRPGGGRQRRREHGGLGAAAHPDRPHRGGGADEEDPRRRPGRPVRPAQLRPRPVPLGRR